jgi:hypothetical protein
LEQGLHRGQAKLGVFFLGLGAIATFFVAVGLLLYFKPGSGSPAPDIFVAGPVDGFKPGTLTYFQSEHVYVVRLMDGAFIALYDLGPRMQALFNDSQDPIWLQCRVAIVEQDAGLFTALGTAPPGFEGVVLREPCHGATWDAAGLRLFGPATGDLDRFPVTVVGDKVHIDVGARRCVNPIGPQAPCLPTQ